MRARDVEIIGRINSGDHLVNQGVGCGGGNGNERKSCQFDQTRIVG